MTDTNALTIKIKSLGLQKSFVADKLGLTMNGLHNKVKNKTEFTGYEIAALKKLLHLTDAEVNTIFLGGK